MVAITQLTNLPIPFMSVNVQQVGAALTKLKEMGQGAYHQYQKLSDKYGQLTVLGSTGAAAATSAIAYGYYHPSGPTPLEKKRFQEIYNKPSRDIQELIEFLKSVRLPFQLKSFPALLEAYEKNREAKEAYALYRLLIKIAKKSQSWKKHEFQRNHKHVPSMNSHPLEHTMVKYLGIYLERAEEVLEEYGEDQRESSFTISPQFQTIINMVRQPLSDGSPSLPINTSRWPTDFKEELYAYYQCRGIIDAFKDNDSSSYAKLVTGKEAMIKYFS